MRAGLRVAPAGLLSGMALAVIEVRCDYWREFWFVSKENAGSYTLDCYATEADARAETHKLAAGTHAAGELQVTMVAEVGAAFDVGPMVVTMRADGATPDALLVWTHNPAGVLVDRIAAILATYTEPYEMLGASGSQEAFGVKVGHQLPGTILRAVGVTDGSYGLEDSVQQYQQGVVNLTLHAWVSRLENGDGYRDALAAGSALVAIAEEQRTWGGMAGETQVISAAQIAIELPEGGGAVYHALVPIRVQFADMFGTRQATSDEYGTGGVYAAALNP